MLFITICTYAQWNVTGNVAEKNTGKILAGANVMVKDMNGKLLKFTITGNDGTFKIKMPVTAEEKLYIHVSMMGMKTYSAPLLQNTNHLYIQMEEDTQELKEVVVKADRIRESGDTVVYLVSSFAQKQDHTIGDVLQRMPGIDVAVDGKIQYQGMDINKFYIEGSDLLGGKYGIATNGISHDDIASVEVMENHQPMQVLQNIAFSDKAAINLKLKNKSKASWILNGYLGGGWENSPKGGLWNGELFLMTVMPNYQTITTFKSNNTGTDLRNQVTDFFANKRSTELGDYFSIQLPVAPSLKAVRTNFNRSWMFSSSNLWNLKSSIIKAQIDYYNHRATGLSSTVSTYFLSNGDKVISEDRSGVEHNNRLTGNFSIERNEKKHYLNNTLKTELNWENTETTMTGTLPNFQNAHTPDFYISNDLKLIRRIRDKHLLTLTSVNEWEKKPQRIVVDYSNSDEAKFSQYVSNQAFYTNEKASYGLYLKGLLLSLEGGFSGYIRDMESLLKEDANHEEQVKIENSVTTNYISIYASPKIEYTFRKMEFSLQYPFNYTYYQFNGKIDNRSEYFHSPLLDIRWLPNPRFSISLSGRLGRSPMNLRDIQKEAILSDYRTFIQGVEDFYVNSDKRISTRIRYKNILKGIFFNVFAIKSWSNRPYKVSEYFVDNYIVSSYEETPSHSQNLNILGNVTKTLNFLNGSIGVNGGYLKINKDLISEGVPTAYYNTTWNIGSRLTGAAGNWINWSYDFKFNRSTLNIISDKVSQFDRYIHYLNITLTPIDALIWQVGGEIYRDEISKSNYKNIFFGDTKLTWKINKQIELSASLTNILNCKEYSYTTYNTVSSIQSTRFLRGREFLFTIHLKN